MHPRQLWLVLPLLAFMAVSAIPAHANRVRDVRIGDHDSYTRCVVELDGPGSYRTHNSSRTHRMVALEIRNVIAGPDSATMAGKSGVVEDVRVAASSSSGVFFVHLKTTHAVRIESSRLTNPDRLVFDLYPEPESKPASISAIAPVSAATPAPAPERTSETVSGESRPEARFRPRVIVIDPGHGGRHRGGFGFVPSLPGKSPQALPRAFREDYRMRRGVRLEEAEVTLPIAKNLQGMLAADPRFEPRLTRQSDVYVGLRERTRRAEEFGGDYFVSIHYNAVPETADKNRARGLEFFTWSPQTADNVADRYLQALENEEGADSELSHTGRDAREVLSQMMLDALEEQALASRTAAKALEDSFLRDSYFKKHYRGSKSARFKVLENYNMPSVLIEVAFISNPDEARLAADSDFQKRVARYLYDGIVAYFERTDPSLKANTLARR